jgi:hypothetical protein
MIPFAETGGTEAVIILSSIADVYIIEHIAGRNKPVRSYSFREALIPQKALQHIRSLSLFTENRSCVFKLDPRQQAEVTSILQKITDEKRSAYRYSDFLQKTYLMELIHCLTKIHHNLSHKN